MILALFLSYWIRHVTAAPLEITIDIPDELAAHFEQVPDTVGWVGDPDGRGTFGLVSSCLITLTLCVWSALHLNVPPSGTTFKRTAYTRTKWVIVGIFAPELLVATAFAQYLTARWLYNEIKKDAKHRIDQSDMPEPPAQPTWTMMQCFFATMGGVAVQTRSTVFEGSPKITLSAEGVRLLSFLGMLPETNDREIRDKSKGDWLAKGLVVIQAIYIIIQAISRLAAHMPVTLLEVNTIGHVICALTLYLLWWNKPLELDHPQVLPYEPVLEPVIALLYMCSPMSEKMGISEIRCMEYKTPYRSTNSSAKETPTELPQYTNFSVGSKARVDPKAFIGVAPAKRGIARSATRFDYTMEEKYCEISPEHLSFLELQNGNTMLQHAPKYCRWAQSDIDHKRQPRLSSFEIERWRLAGPASHQLWQACQERKEYENYYFTTSSLGVFLGETYYLDDHIKNFAGLSYLGHVNVHRDHLKTILAFTAAAYGGLHIAAWREYFPTNIERILWIVSSIFISCSGLISFAVFFAKQKIPAFDRWVNAFTTHSWYFYKRSHMAQTNAAYFWQVVTAIIGAGVIACFGCARIFLVVEAFVSLRDVPKEVYDTPNWTNFFPHF